MKAGSACIGYFQFINKQSYTMFRLLLFVTSTTKSFKNKNKKVVIALLVLQVGLLSFNTYAEDCFGRDILIGTIRANPNHLDIAFEINFNSMTALIDKRIEGNSIRIMGNVTQLRCREHSLGNTKTIHMIVTGHDTYICDGFVHGTDTDGYTVTMTCPVEFSFGYMFPNKFTGRLLSFSCPNK